MRFFVSHIVLADGKMHEEEKAKKREVVAAVHIAGSPYS